MASNVQPIQSHQKEPKACKTKAINMAELATHISRDTYVADVAREAVPRHGSRVTLNSGTAFRSTLVPPYVGSR